jgi:murein DD-endopeptidase MepM/ murein hydrolase activator NlpD
MQVGWPGLSRAIALTIALTSAFWVALGAWLFNDHVSANHANADQGGKRVVTSDDGGRADGLLSGFGGAGAVKSGSAPASRRGGLTSSSAGIGPMRIPVAGIAASELEDTFTQARAAGARSHDAIDILAPEGTPVIAAAPGRVEKLFLSEEGGNTVYVRSGDRRQIFYYAHLASYAPGLREGQAVQAGQVLGTVGYTGNADPAAPHLHFAVSNADPRQGWSQEALAINPYPLLARRSMRNTGSN